MKSSYLPFFLLLCSQSNLIDIISSSKLLCYQILSVEWAVLSSHVSLNIIGLFPPPYCVLGVLKAGRTVADVGLASIVSGWWVPFKGSHFCIYFKVSMTGYFSRLNVSMLGKISEFWMRYSSVTTIKNKNSEIIATLSSVYHSLDPVPFSLCILFL